MKVLVNKQILFGRFIEIKILAYILSIFESLYKIR